MFTRKLNACGAVLCLVLACTMFCNGGFAATLTWTGAQNDGGLWNTTTNWSPNGIPGAADTAIINAGNGSPVLQTSVTVAGLTLGGTKTVTVGAGLTLTATTVALNDGDINGGLGTFAIAAGGTLVSDHPTGSNTIDNVLSNAGSITVNSGGLTIFRAAANTGSITATNAGTNFTVINGGASFVNSGAATISGTFVIGTNAVFTVNNNLTLNGTLQTTGNNGNVINGSGSLTVQGTLNIADVVTISLPTTVTATSTLLFNRGSNSDGVINLNSNATLTVDGDATFTTNNGIDIASGSTATFNKNVSFNQSDITGNGILAIGAAGVFTSTNITGNNSISSDLNNLGAIAVGSGKLLFTGGSGTNSGSVTATAAGASTELNTFVFVNTGGGTISGVFTVATNATFTVNNNLTLNGTLRTDGNNGSVINGSGTLTVAGTFNVADVAALSVPTTVTAASNLLFNQGTNASGFLNVNSNATLTVNGTATFTQNNGMDIASGSTVTFNSTVALTQSDITGNGLLVVGAAGVLTSNIPVGLNDISSDLNNAGTITVNSSTLRLVSGTGTNTGSIVATAVGAVLEVNSFTLVNSGAGTVSGTLTVGTNGTFTVNNTLTVNGSLRTDGNNGSTINGAGALTVNGTFNVADNATLTVPTTVNTASSLLFNRGTNADGFLNVSGSGTLTVNGTTTFTQNNGINVASPSTVALNGSVALAQSDIQGSGTLTLGAVATLTSTNIAGTNFLNSIVTNAGTVIVQSGVLNIGTNFVQTGGMIQLGGGSVQGTVNVTGGSTMGAGTITGDLNNNGGVIEPGASPGRLLVTGALRQLAAGKTRIEIAGRTAATEFDQISVGGTATLDGDVDVVFLNGFTPVPGDSFEILNAASRSGQYRTINSTLVSADYSDPAKVILRANAPNPVPTISAITPSGASAGGPDFVLLVTGTGFVDGISTVQVNGAARTTTFVFSTLLAATVTAADIALAGTLNVTVVNPAPGGGTTAASPLIVGGGGGGTGAPAITSPLTASATVGTAFTYPITATGTGPITFGAFNLPPGLAFTGSAISGTPTQGGQSNISLTATNAAGSVSAVLVLTISSGAANVGPTFASLPTISINPTLVNVAVTFSAAADDGNGDLLAYSWNFGDGTTGTGASVTHAFASSGTFTVVVTASDGVSSATSSIPVAVNAAKPLGGVGINVFAILKVGVKFSFSSGNKDALSLQGTVPLGTGFSPAGKAVVFTVGGLTRNFTLNDKGIGGDKVNAFKLAFKVKDANTPAKFAVSLKSQSLFADLQSLGYRNADVGKPGDDVILPVIISIDGSAFGDSLTTIYTAKAGSGGSAKR